MRMQIFEKEVETSKLTIRWRPQNSTRWRPQNSQPGGDLKTHNQVETSKLRALLRVETLSPVQGHRPLLKGYNSQQVKEDMGD